MDSGKFVLRLNPKIHKALKEEARALGESLNTICVQKIQGVMSHPWSLVTSQIVSQFHPIGIVLFGSTARGEAKTESDIDLLITLPDPTEIKRSLYTHWDQEFASHDKFSPQFVHLPKLPNVGSIWLECAIEGEILYDPQNEIKKTFRQIRRMIAEGKYQRKVSNGHAYWIRQDIDAK